MDYEQLEKDICALLCPTTTDETGKTVQLNTVYQARPLPDNQSEYTASFSKPIAYIVCSGSNYGDRESTDMVVQDETINLEAILRAKTRLGASGIFAVANDIRAKLMGYKFRGCSKIQFISSGYMDNNRTQNDWNYSISFSLTTKAVENLPEAVEPVYTNIIHNS